MIELLILFIAFILGAFVGSFLNLVSVRLQSSEPIIRGRSHCDYCKKILSAFQLIPVFSFVFGKGKSACCKKKLSYYYPFSELLTGVGFVLITNYADILNKQGFLDYLYLFFMLSIFAIYVCILLSDMKYRIIPDKLVLAGILVTALVLFAQSLFVNVSLYNDLRHDIFGQYLLQVGYFSDKLLLSLKTLFGTFLSAIGIWLFFIALIIITKGRGMGGGDAKLGFLIGLVNGFPANILAIFLGFISGALYSIVLLVTKRTTIKSTIPFGPFLIIGSVVTFIWGTEILRWYFGL